jgi:hypothetical protein
MDPEQQARVDEWVALVSAELGVSAPAVYGPILDVAKYAAHQVERPSAPITAYLVGLAVAGGADAEQSAEVIRRLAAEWEARQQ